MTYKVSSAVLGIVLLALLPILLPDAFLPSPEFSLSNQIGKLLSYLIPIGAVIVCYRIIIHQKAQINARILIMFFVLLAMLLTYIHVELVDNGHFNASPPFTNLKWQKDLQNEVVKLNISVLPHSYRFLPNSFTRFIEYLTGDYRHSRDLYRLTFTFFLLFSIYQFALLFVNHPQALLVVLLYCVLYPLTLRNYSGQLTDPMSHLSFVIAFIALRTNRFAYFVLALGIGTLAKESVLALLGFYCLFYYKTDSHFWKKFFFSTLIGVGIFLIVRIVVSSGEFGVGYSHITDNPTGHLENNFQGPWKKLFFFSVGIFLPLSLFNWRQTPTMLKQLILYLFPVLLLSNWIFSWLQEIRNFVPLIIPILIAGVNGLFHSKTSPQSK